MTNHSLPVLRLLPRRPAPLLLLASILMLASFTLLPLPALGDGPVNVECPVRPEDPLVPDLNLHYGEHEIGFCCEHCRGMFAEDPEPYLAMLPANVAAAVRAVHSPEQAPIDLTEHLDLVTLLIVLLTAIIAWRRGTQGGRRLALTLVGLSLVALAVTSWWRAQGARLELQEAQAELEQVRWKELIHNNTYYDFGTPPRPLRPPVEPRLQATFYRGNDERSDKLWNGGHYLTSFFDLSLLDASGDAPLQHGDDVNGIHMALRFQIRRGPHTPDFFWSDDLLGDIFLTAEADPFLGQNKPVVDRQNLKTGEEMQRWYATYPLGRIFGQGEETLEKVIYVADAWYERGRMIGATFHYGIVVKLEFQDGVLTERSEVYMGALFRPRKSPLSKVSHEEWLSHEPIPPLPAPQGDDPETLGISDYRDSG